MTDPTDPARLLRAQISRTIGALKATGTIKNRHSNGLRVFRAAPEPGKPAARRKTTTTTITITTVEEQGQ